MANNDGCVKKAIVLVLGDIGHSPRMCYHASSLASHSVNVELVGYSGSEPHPEVLKSNLIRIVHLPKSPKWFNSKMVPRIFQLFLKVFFMFFTLFWTLLFRTSFQVSILFVQNPPGIPAMLICYWVSRLKRAAFIIDWHNYSYTMLRQSFPKSYGHSKIAKFSNGLKEFCVNFAYKLEGFSGRCADRNVCVSTTMRQDLKERWNINAITVHDKPPKWNFISMNCSERHELFHRLFNTDSFAKYTNTLDTLKEYSESTLFTSMDNNSHAKFRDDRPLLLISSTSWTEDEDFGILLDALKDYDKNAELRNACTNKVILPKLFVVITGKGPQKEFYLEKISHMRMRHVEIVTAWLEAEDYPKLLASADLGVSLHTSTSGLDLPMKIVDMFGCGLPVLAKRFQAIDEQVTEGQNGRLFDTPTNLRQILIELATGFPNNQPLNELKRNIVAEHRTDWHEQWDALLWRVIDEFLLIPEQEYDRWERFKALPEDFEPAKGQAEDSIKKPKISKKHAKKMVLVSTNNFAEDDHPEDVSVSDSNISVDN